MDHPAKLIAALALALGGSAHAGYAQLKPPPGWSPGRYAPAANDATFGPVIHAPSGPTTTVGGQSVKMPAAYRLASNAPRFAAAAIFAHPYVRVGAAIATWLGLAGLVWDAVNNRWVKGDTSYPQSDGFQYQYRGQNYSTAQQACQAYIAYVQPSNPGVTFTVAGVAIYASSARCTINARSNSASWTDIVDVSKSGSNCPVGWYVTPAGCVQTPPPNQVSQEEFVETLAPKPMPERVPLELPKPTPLPIEQPSPWINPEPGPNPQHRPLFVPTGDPVPNPQYDPNTAPSPANQPFIQPGVRVVPSPTAIEPWRVDMQPVNRPAPTNQPMPSPEPEPVRDPQDPGAENGDKPKPEEQQSLCEKHPDIVACAKLGNAPDAEAVPNDDRELSIQQDSGWGEGTGSCPAPKTVQVHGFQLSMPFDLLCQFASGIRPVVIGLAWLAAAFTFMGLGRRD